MDMPTVHLKYLEPYGKRKGPEFHVTGVGVDEPMPPCLVNRPYGTGSWLFMQFHHPVAIEAADGRLERQALSFMIWPDGASHVYGNAKEAWSHSWLHCVGAEVGAIVSDAGLPVVTPFALPSKSPVNRILTQIHAEIAGRRKPDESILLLYLRLLCKELARAAGPDEGALAQTPERILAARRHIESKPGSKISLEKLAKTAGLSVSRFSAEFKRHIGKSPIDYLIDTRIARSAYLLRDMNLSVAEVAAEVGYKDPFQFSKIFSKRYGKSPREARKGFKDSIAE